MHHDPQGVVLLSAISMEGLNLMSEMRIWRFLVIVSIAALSAVFLSSAYAEDVVFHSVDSHLKGTVTIEKVEDGVSQYRVRFSITNTGQEPYGFRKAMYGIESNSGAHYLLELPEFSSTSGVKGGKFLNPSESASILCRSSFGGPGIRTIYIEWPGWFNDEVIYFVPPAEVTWYSSWWGRMMLRYPLMDGCVWNAPGPGLNGEQYIPTQPASLGDCFLGLFENAIHGAVRPQNNKAYLPSEPSGESLPPELQKLKDLGYTIKKVK